MGSGQAHPLNFIDFDRFSFISYITLACKYSIFDVFISIITSNLLVLHKLLLNNIFKNAFLENIS